MLVDENRVCKICDFGLARLLPEDNIYERKSKVICVCVCVCVGGGVIKQSATVSHVCLRGTVCVLSLIHI